MRKKSLFLEVKKCSDLRLEAERAFKLFYGDPQSIKARKLARYLRLHRKKRTKKFLKRSEKHEKNLLKRYLYKEVFV